MAQTERRIDGNIDLARKMLLQSGQTALANDHRRGLRHHPPRRRRSIQRIEATKLSVIKSNQAMQKALDSARGISREQALKSEEQVKNIGENQQQILSGVRQAVQNATTLSFVMIAVSLAVALISLVISLRIIASITRPLAHAKLVTQEIAGGRPHQADRAERASDEIGEICASINNIVVHFHEVISRVAQNTQQVSSASAQLSCAAEQMASGRCRVAGQADTVATASEEMAATSNEIAQNCHLGRRQLPAGQRSAAAAGAEVVQETVAGMNQIAENVQESAAQHRQPREPSPSRSAASSAPSRTSRTRPTCWR